MCTDNPLSSPCIVVRHHIFGESTFYQGKIINTFKDSFWRKGTLIHELNYVVLKETGEIETISAEAEHFQVLFGSLLEDFNAGVWSPLRPNIFLRAALWFCRLVNP